MYRRPRKSGQWEAMMALYGGEKREGGIMELCRFRLSRHSHHESFKVLDEGDPRHHARPANILQHQHLQTPTVASNSQPKLESPPLISKFQFDF